MDVVVQTGRLLGAIPAVVAGFVLLLQGNPMRNPIGSRMALAGSAARVVAVATAVLR